MKKTAVFILFVVAILIVNASCKKGDNTATNTDSTGWRELGDLNANNDIYAVAVDNDGHVYAAGGFTNANKNRYVAKWDGKSWNELGSIDAKEDIKHLFVDKNNNVYAEIDKIITDEFSYIVKWDGSSWKSITNDDISKPGTEISGATISAAGKLYAVKNDYPILSVVKYEDTGWAEVCSLSPNVHGPIAVDYKGDVHAVFMNADNNLYLAKWDGNAWTELGSENSIKNLLKKDVSIYMVTIDSKGNLYAAGMYTGAIIYFLIKWDGNSWTEVKDLALPVGNYINCLATDVYNDVYVGGETGNGSGDLVAYKYDGNRWAQLNKVSKNLTMRGRIWSLAIDSKRNVYAGGNFDKIVNSHIVHYIAVYPGQ